jgi:hypothetical protein
MSSCKDFLDIKPDGVTVPKTTEEYFSLINSTLYSVETGSAKYLLGNTGDILDVEQITDNLFRNVLYKYLKVDVTNRFTSSDAGGYSNLYSTIRDCNLVIENVSKSEKIEEAEKNLLGTCFTIRAIAYFNLVRN